MPKQYFTERFNKFTSTLLKLRKNIKNSKKLHKNQHSSEFSINKNLLTYEFTLNIH